MSHRNHASGTTQPSNAPAASRKLTAEAMPSSGVTALSVSPGGISVLVSEKNGHSSPPPTHQGGGACPGAAGTNAVTLSCAPSRSRSRTAIHMIALPSSQGFGGTRRYRGPGVGGSWLHGPALADPPTPFAADAAAAYRNAGQGLEPPHL